MKIREYLNERHKANDYPRSWDTETNLWKYSHRAKLGLTPKDKHLVVHHKNGDINDFRKYNLQAVTRAEHAALGKPALKHEKCKYCGKKHFAKGLCRQHYYKKFHK